jgi:hypothetical protein
MFAGSPGQLANRRRRAVENLGDLGVPVAENLVQHEYGTLQRAQRLQDHQQCHGQRLGTLHGLGRVTRLRSLGCYSAAARHGDHRLRQPGTDVVVTATADARLTGHAGGRDRRVACGGDGHDVGVGGFRRLPRL